MLANQALNRKLVVTEWPAEGKRENIEGGMEFIEFTDEIKALLKKAAMEEVVPAWVDRVGGPTSDAVKLYNDLVAPILGVTIDANGQAVRN